MCVRKLCPHMRKEKKMYVCTHMRVSGCSIVGQGAAVAAQKTLVRLLPWQQHCHTGGNKRSI